MKLLRFHHNLFQGLINCTCKIYLGSVDQMKGNEARIIFFLHAVDQFKAGQVQRKQTNGLEVLAQEDDTERKEERGKKRKQDAGDTTRKRRKEKGEEKKREDLLNTVLLTTKPYYLAITRSSCEVNLRDVIREAQPRQIG